MATAIMSQQPMPVAPPSWVDLSFVPAGQALSDITFITNNFKNVDNAYAQALWHMMRDLAWHRKWVTVGYIPAPPAAIDLNREIIKQIIGQDGCYFKMTTENCGIDFIYYDQERELILFWGPSKFTVSNAMKIIRSRICRIIAKQRARPSVSKLRLVDSE